MERSKSKTEDQWETKKCKRFDSYTVYFKNYVDVKKSFIKWITKVWHRKSMKISPKYINKYFMIQFKTFTPLLKVSICIIYTFLRLFANINRLYVNSRKTSNSLFQKSKINSIWNTIKKYKLLCEIVYNSKYKIRQQFANGKFLLILYCLLFCR